MIQRLPPLPASLLTLHGLAVVFVLALLFCGRKGHQAFAFRHPRGPGAKPNRSFSQAESTSNPSAGLMVAWEMGREGDMSEGWKVLVGGSVARNRTGLCGARLGRRMPDAAPGHLARMPCAAGAPQRARGGLRGLRVVGVARRKAQEKLRTAAVCWKHLPLPGSGLRRTPHARPAAGAHHS